MHNSLVGTRTVFLRNGLNWAGFLGTALVLNIILFSLMPLLVANTSRRPDVDEFSTPITIMHLKPPEPSVKKKTEPPPPPVKRQNSPKPMQARTAPAKLSLPFEIDTRLPASGDTLSLPVLPPTDLGNVDNIFTAGDLDSGLTTLVRIPPIYPMSAKNRGVEGWVRVRFIVNEDGSVSDIAITQSKPQKIFDDAVLRSVAGWRFKPGTVDGVAVKTRAETVVRFNLD